MVTNKNFISTVIESAKPNHLLIFGLLLLLKLTSNNYFMAVEIFLLGQSYSDLPSTDLAP